MKRPLLLLLILILISCGSFWLYSQNHAYDSRLRVVMLDVGQGDSTFIQTPSGYQLLIDTGPNDGSAVSQLESVMPLFDHSINMVMLSHPDADHIGGLSEILNRYDVSDIIDNQFPTGTTIARQARVLEQQEPGARIDRVHTGGVIHLPDDVNITILHPRSGFVADATNNASVTARIDYGTTSFLFTGDEDSTVESDMVAHVPAKLLDIDVLKIAHHGSRFSSSLSFLRAVSPQMGLVSYACQNDYGHPHKETVRRFQSLQIPVFDTCDSGRITVWSDGYNLQVETQKGSRV